MQNSEGKEDLNQNEPGLNSLLGGLVFLLLMAITTLFFGLILHMLFSLVEQA